MASTCVTLVTGSSSGLGRAIAVELSKRGRILLGGRDVARLEETRLACSRPDEHLLWPQDLKDVGAIDASLRRRLLDGELAVEAFVHAAGIVRILPMRVVELATTVETMNVNFLAAAEIVRLLVKRAVNHQQLKNIVFVSSTASKFGARGFNLYCASKGALDAFMRALAVELAPAVRVNSVLPGAVRTPMTEAMFANPETRRNIEKDYPLGVGTPADIAAAVDFLLSERARWISGQQLVVDGARTVNISA